MTTRQIGIEGFRWFIGVVEDREDPEKLGRVKTRIYGVHGNEVENPLDTLPWAIVLMPCYSSSLQRVGQSATGLQVGSTVIGFFMDGNEVAMPIIFGVLPAKEDMSKLAEGENTIEKQILGPEPETAYGTIYPYNKVFQTESGHAFEVDDTPNKERIHWYHKTGTYMEVNEEGRRVNRIVGDDFEIVEKDQTVYIKGNVNVEVVGNVDMKVGGNVTLKVDGNVDVKVDGTYDVESGGNMSFKAPRIDLN